MHKLPLALLLSTGLIFSGCKSNKSKPQEAAPAPAATAAVAEAPAPATPAKPECPPEAPAKKKTSAKTKTTKTAKPAKPTPTTDCEPAKAKAEAPAPANAAAAPAPTAAAAPAAAAAGQAKAGAACNPCAVKSRDGTFDGEVYGSIPPGSKWAKLQIGMHQSEVERILGVTQNIRAYVTAKAWIPFYFGSDSHRYEAVYAGQGSVAYTGGSWGGGQGVLMMINFDPKIQ